MLCSRPYWDGNGEECTIPLTTVSSLHSSLGPSFPITVGKKYELREEKAATDLGNRWPGLWVMWLYSYVSEGWGFSTLWCTQKPPTVLELPRYSDSATCSTWPKTPVTHLLTDTTVSGLECSMHQLLAFLKFTLFPMNLENIYYTLTLADDFQCLFICCAIACISYRNLLKTKHTAFFSQV